MLEISEKTAWKNKDDVLRNKNGEVIRPLTKKEFDAKTNAALHIDELVEVSKIDSRDSDKKHRHDADNFSYRTAYFRDYDGQYYALKFSVIESGMSNTVYNIGKIEKRDFPFKNRGSSEKIGAQGETSNNSILENSDLSTGKLSLKEKNTEYLKAVEVGDMDTAQEMVDEAAKEAGYRYRRNARNKGTPKNNAADYYMFVEDTTNQSLDQYGEYRYVATDDNAIDVSEIKDAINDAWARFAEENDYPVELTEGEIDPEDIVISAGIWDNIDFVAFLFDKGIIDYDVKAIRTNDGLLVFDESQIKSADPVTYDDDGNVIPLSERFKTEKKDIRYSLKKEPSQNSSIKQQIRNNLDKLNSMNVVSTATYEEKSKGEMRREASTAFKKIGYKVDIKDFGIVLLGENELDAAFNYLNDQAEYAAITCVPDVLKRGLMLVDEIHGNHKGRGFETVTFAGPVKINGIRGNMAVIVKSTTKNRYKTHRILMPDGSEFVFAKKETELTSSGVNSNNEFQRADISSVNPIISQNPDLSTENSKKSLKTTDAEKRVAELAKELEQIRDSWVEGGEFTGSRLPSETQLKKTVDVLMDGYSGEKTKKGLTVELQELYGDIRRYRDAKTTGYKDKLWPAINQRLIEISSELCDGRVSREKNESGINLYSENMYRAKLAQKLELMYCLFEMPNFTREDMKAGTDVNRLYEKMKAARAERDAALEKVREQRKKAIKALKLAETTDAEIDQKYYESEARKKLLRVAKRLASIKYVNREMTVDGQKVNVGQLIDRAVHDAVDSLSSIKELDVISIGMRRSTREWLEDLSAWYSEQKRSNGDFYGDDKTEAELARLSKINIKQMSINDVERLTDALLNVENTIRTQNKMIDSEDKRNFQEQGAVVINDVNHLAGINKGLWDDIVTESLSPLRAVSRITGYNDEDPLMMRTRELNDGQRKMLAWIVKYKAMFNEFTSDKAYMKKVTGRSADIVMRSGDGIMTRGMLMSLYLHSTNKQNMAHVEFGGAVLPNGKLYEEGKIRDAYAKKTIVKMSRSQIVKLANEQLDEKDFKFIAAVKRYFNVEAKAGINEVSNKLLGYDLAKVGEYFPISVNGAFTKAEYEQIKCDGSVAGMGNLKERVDSRLPIDLVDMTTVLNRAIDLNAKYIGLAVPVRNMSKLLRIAKVQSGTDANGVTVLEKVIGGDGFEHYIYDTSVMDAIEKKWGKNGADYIKNMLADVQGLNIKDRNTFTDLFDGLRSNYAQAVLTINPAVALKQTASYPTAAAVIGWKALLKGLNAKRNVNLDVVSRYTPLLAYRSLGYTDADLGAIVNRRGRLPKGLNWIQFMDVLTTKRLWAACEYYIEEHKPSLERRSDEYYKAVAEVYNRVVEETQPNYTAMQRPQMLRSNDTLLKNLAMFKTQPMQNLNLIYDAIGNYRAKNAMYVQNPTAENSAALKEAKARLGRVISSQIVQAVMMAAITLGWNAARGKLGRYKDDDDETIFNGKGFARFMIDVVENLGSGIPFASDAASIAEAIAGIYTDGKFTYYGIEAATPAMISDMVSGIGNFLHQLNRAVEGNAKTEKVISATENAASEIAKVFGIPVGNVINMMKIILRAFGVEW